MISDTRSRELAWDVRSGMKREVGASNAVLKGKGIRHKQFCMARFSERSMRGSDDQSPPLTPSAAG